jgi:hypothetical protein
MSASTRIDFVKETSYTFEIDIVDDDGEPVPLADLEGASAEFFLRTSPSSNVDVLHFTTADPDHLAFKPNEAALILKFAANDTASVAVGAYSYRVLLVLADGRSPDIIEWSPFDVGLGGVAEDAPPVFENTVALDHNFELDDALRYMSPGGTPIANAQVRVYLKSDYDAKLYSNAVGKTITKSDGRWKDPVLVTPGYTYVIQFTKPNEFGPDTATVIA